MTTAQTFISLAIYIIVVCAATAYRKHRMYKWIKRHKPHWTAFDIRTHFDNAHFFGSTLLYVNAILLAIAVLYAITQNIMQ